MSLTKIGSIGINTGIQFAGVTTITTLNGSDAVLSVGGTVNFNSDVSIGGSVSIGGTLTYEDVTNIDSVGLITARAGVVVGSGITLSKDGDIFATGITTVSGNVKVGSGITLSPDGDIFFTGIMTGNGSGLTGVSGVSVANQSDNRVITNTGTTDALNAEANLVFTGTRLGLNQTSPAPLNGDGTGMIHVAGGNPELVLERTTSGTESKASIRITDGEDFKIAVKDGSGSTIDAFAIDTGTGNITASGTVAATSYTGDGSSLTGISAISNAQQFRLAANQAGSSSAGTVLTNWEEVDTDYQAIGSNWSQSSGVFSCSATGIYVCFWSLVVSGTNTGDAYDPNIQISTDSGGSYNTRNRAWAQVSTGTVDRAHVQNQFLFDVSNTSTFRLRFRQSQSNDLASGTTIAGSSSETYTNIMFIRLGNT